MKKADFKTIAERCSTLGLTISQAHFMAHAGEGFGPLDLPHVLGLNAVTMVPLKPRKWLWMAAQTCSVSYRKILTPETLLNILTTGDVPEENISNIVHFLQEAPVQNVVMAVDQAAQQSGLPPELLWRNLEMIATLWQCHRLFQLPPTESARV
ncbi:hypothetical protein [Janthinobacterium sp. P210005]|uniref:hypothetical protein n=1 Tax=Janthinobacterium sp. P210005 TaxID=3112938 RepID=UPI002E274F9B|nr:hypothetical protein [Janthinobacterium sp. P210005]